MISILLIASVVVGEVLVSILLVESAVVGDYRQAITSVCLEIEDYKYLTVVIYIYIYLFILKFPEYSIHFLGSYQRLPGN